MSERPVPPEARNVALREAAKPHLDAVVEIGMRRADVIEQIEKAEDPQVLRDLVAQFTSLTRELHTAEAVAEDWLDMPKNLGV